MPGGARRCLIPCPSVPFTFPPTRGGFAGHLSLANDIFGRDKFREEQAGNGGIGAFTRHSKCLYVHFGGAAEVGAARLRDMILKSFTDWGPLKDIYVIPSKCIAFVR